MRKPSLLQSFDAGRMDREITIQQNTRTKNTDTGEVTRTGWSTFATIWGEYRPTKAIETIKMGGEVTDIDITIRTRFRADIVPNMRMIVEGKTYKINAVEEITFSRGQWMEISAKALKQ